MKLIKINLFSRKSLPPDVQELIYDGMVQRSWQLCYLFGAFFPLYGFVSYGYLKHYLPQLTLWDNIYPRILLNTIPCAAMYLFFKKSKLSNELKSWFAAVAFPIIFIVTCRIWVLGLALDGHPEILTYVHAANLIVPLFIYLMIGPSPVQGLLILCILTLGLYQYNIPYLWKLPLPYLREMYTLESFLFTLLLVTGSLAAYRTRARTAFIEVENNQRKSMEIFYLEKEVRKRTQEALDLKVAKSLGEMSAQISHDLRSPLAALQILLPDINELQEEKRIILRSAVMRVNDICNQLLTQYRAVMSEKKQIATHQSSLVSIPSLLDEIVTEKRIQYRPHSTLSIEYIMDLESYGLFANVNENELKRIISNLVNNSVEAVDNFTGQVRVHVLPKENGIEIQVHDNGRGIDATHLKSLITGNSGSTKDGGFGLGLSHAKTTVESWKGSISIRSEVGTGTTLSIQLPRATPPLWFLEELTLTPSTTVVVVDDDSNIYQTWKRIFSDKGLVSENLHHFSNAAQLKSWLPEHSQTVSKALFLVDFEFIGSPMNGIELIKSFGLSDHAILVTSRYEDKRVQSECLANQIKLLPKSMVGLVPVLIS